MGTELEELLVDSLRRVRINLAALVPDPKNPDFMLALQAGNPADNRELCDAYEEINQALAAYEEKAQEQKVTY